MLRKHLTHIYYFFFLSLVWQKNCRNNCECGPLTFYLKWCGSDEIWTQHLIDTGVNSDVSQVSTIDPIAQDANVNPGINWAGEFKSRCQPSVIRCLGSKIVCACWVGGIVLLCPRSFSATLANHGCLWAHKCGTSPVGSVWWGMLDRGWELASDQNGGKSYGHCN